MKLQKNEFNFFMRNHFGITFVHNLIQLLLHFKSFLSKFFFLKLIFGFAFLRQQNEYMMDSKFFILYFFIVDPPMRKMGVVIPPRIFFANAKDSGRVFTEKN